MISVEKIELFFELIQVALGQRKTLNRILTSQEWQELYVLCQRQSVLGVAFHALEHIGNQKPPKSILFDWIGVNEQLRQKNLQMNRACFELSEAFEKEGFDSCILKGQGNTLLYTFPYSRTPGDIDIWITPHDKSFNEKKRRNIVLYYIRNKYPKANLHYNHIEAGKYRGISVEVHHRPRFLNNYIHNYRLQKWIEEKREGQFKHRVVLPEMNQQVAIPTIVFNIVFQLAHIYGHVLQGGIGMRHIIDYYYLLLTNNGEKKDYYSYTFKQIGLYKIAQAVVWVLNTQIGLKKNFLIVPPDERTGRILLQDIMDGGNFGQYNSHAHNVKSHVRRNLYRLKRDFQLMRYFPSECLWEPVFRVYHYFWRLRYNNIRVKRCT